MDLTDKNQLINYLKQNGLWAKKSMGQNFLVDRAALDKIVEAAELKSSDTVLEIGPGVGTLTEELIKFAGSVIAIEKDERLVALLNDKFLISNVKLNPPTSLKLREAGNLQILNEDALVFNAKKLQPTTYKLVANIPYYITSKILEKFLSGEHKPELIVLLVQKEVAERICARPRSTSSGQAGDMSLLAVSVQYYGEPEIVDIVRRTSFFPVPEVDSAILRIKIGEHHHPTSFRFYSNPTGSQSNLHYEGQADLVHRKDTEKEFFKTVKVGFRARRKTLFNNLKAGTNLNNSQILEILDKMKLDRKVRAQELTVEEWEELADEISQKL